MEKPLLGNGVRVRVLTGRYKGERGIITATGWQGGFYVLLKKSTEPFHKLYLTQELEPDKSYIINRRILKRLGYEI